MAGEGADQLAAQPGVSAGDDALAQMIQSEEARRHNNKTAATFKDGMLKIEDIIQEGNTVAVRSTHTATQAGPFMGLGSRGRPFTITIIGLHECNDGGMVRTTWHQEDWLGGLFQIGAFEP